MKKCDNQSCNRIIDYLNQEDDLMEEERRYLNYYAIQLYKNNVENIEKETINDIYDSLKVLSEHLKYLEDTSITKARINEIINILLKMSTNEIRNEDICDISYKLDKLFCETDLPLRKNSSLSYNLINNMKRKR